MKLKKETALKRLVKNNYEKIYYGGKIYWLDDETYNTHKITSKTKIYYWNDTEEHKYNDIELK